MVIWLVSLSYPWPLVEVCCDKGRHKSFVLHRQYVVCTKWSSRPITDAVSNMHNRVYRTLDCFVVSCFLLDFRMWLFSVLSLLIILSSYLHMLLTKCLLCSPFILCTTICGTELMAKCEYVSLEISVAFLCASIKQICFFFVGLQFD